MDSVTQIALGAAVGEAVLGRRLGNKAMLLGGLFGTLPDMDVIVSPLQTPIEFLVHHRELSHSILATLLLSPTLAWLFTRKRARPAGAGAGGRDDGNESAASASSLPATDSLGPPSFQRWLVFFLLVFGTHILLDCFTVYGTQVFAPFSDLRVSFGTVFIIDPLYTLPLLGGLIACAFMRRTSKRRRVTNHIGLAWSTAYLAFGVFAALHARGVFADALQAQGITPKRIMTTPTPFNTVLWYGVAEVDDGYHLGFYSLLDRSKDVSFVYRPRHDERLAERLGELADSYEVRKLKWFADGYYTVAPHASDTGGVLFHVLKFGSFDISGRRELYPFTYRLTGKSNPGIVAERYTPPDRPPNGELFQALWERLKGRP